MLVSSTFDVKQWNWHLTCRSKWPHESPRSPANQARTDVPLRFFQTIPSNIALLCLCFNVVALKDLPYWSAITSNLLRPRWLHPTQIKANIQVSLPFVPSAHSCIYLALHLSAWWRAKGRAHKGRTRPPDVILCQLRAKHGRKKKKKDVELQIVLWQKRPAH